MSTSYQKKKRILNLERTALISRLAKELGYVVAFTGESSVTLYNHGQDFFFIRLPDAVTYLEDELNSIKGHRTNFA